MAWWRLLGGTADHLPLPDASVDCVITDPPAWEPGAPWAGVGGEATQDAYLERLSQVAREWLRVLRPRGSAWVLLHDHVVPRAGAGAPRGDLALTPERAVARLREDGWRVQGQVVWSKPPIPGRAARRPVRTHDPAYLLAAGPHRFRATRAMRASVWELPRDRVPDAVYGTWPRALVERFVEASCPRGGTVLDPFAGSGTTLLAALGLGRSAVGVEPLARQRRVAQHRLAAAGFAGLRRP